MAPQSWSMRRALRLGATIGEGNEIQRHDASTRNPLQFSSVSAAIEELNAGKVVVDNGMCIVYSQLDREFIMLLTDAQFDEGVKIARDCFRYGTSKEIAPTLSPQVRTEKILDRLNLMLDMVQVKEQAPTKEEELRSVELRSRARQTLLFGEMHGQIVREHDSSLVANVQPQPVREAVTPYQCLSDMKSLARQTLTRAETMRLQDSTNMEEQELRLRAKETFVDALLGGKMRAAFSMMELEGRHSVF